MAELINETKDPIRELVGKGETLEVEFKSARGGFPGSFWESYSAFANTNGGTIVLGVVEKNNRFLFDGLTEETIIRYKKIFWDCAHNKGKTSVCLPRESDVRIEHLYAKFPVQVTSFVLSISTTARSATLTGETMKVTMSVRMPK